MVNRNLDTDTAAVYSGQGRVVLRVGILPFKGGYVRHISITESNERLGRTVDGNDGKSLLYRRDT